MKNVQNLSVIDTGRISIREKLAEKKAAIEHKDKAVQKDQDRKTQREM